MKAKDFAKSNGFEPKSFDQWLSGSKYQTKRSIGGLQIEEGQNLDEIAAAFSEHRVELEQEQARAEEAAREQQRQRERAEIEKQQALASMLITSGFNFDGYTITKYSGYISGDDAVQIDRGTASWWGGTTDVGAALMASLVDIRRNAIAELKEAAYDLGCNAVVGVDFDYLTLDPETANSGGGTTYLPYVFGVTANGNAVIIEKNNESPLG